MPAEETANNHPTPGTLQLTQDTAKQPRSILKDSGAELTEEEITQRNTKNNRRRNKTVGYVASALGSEYDNLSTGSAYGLTGIDSEGRTGAELHRLQRKKKSVTDDDREIDLFLKRADSLKKEINNRTKRPIGVRITDPPAKLRSKQQASSNEQHDIDEQHEYIQSALRNLETEKLAKLAEEAINEQIAAVDAKRHRKLKAAIKLYERPIVHTSVYVEDCPTALGISINAYLTYL